MLEHYPTPQGGASLILSFRLANKTVLIIGSSQLAASRAFAALEADATVIILSQGPVETACDEIQWRVKHLQIQYVNWDDLPGSSANEDDSDVLEGFLNTIPKVSLAVVTDTLSTLQRRSHDSAEGIYRVFQARHIPVNTTDLTGFCDFSFTSTHRFENQETGIKTPLQFGVTTNGHGCRLASRIRRDIVAKLPSQIGAAVEKVGRLRVIAKETDINSKAQPNSVSEEDALGEICEDAAVSTPNRPVPSRPTSESASEKRVRRVKWVAQLSEYWPITKLASLSEEEMKGIFTDDNLVPPEIGGASKPAVQLESIHFDTLSHKTGRILLVGSGPGHPSLLTIATHTALTQLADLVLSDKLVPDAVLALIPKHVEIRIARKFPGNAEGAQTEMMEAAVEAATRGLTVVRLKQGDPVVYGRAGEEVLYFRSHGFEALVIPGVSSALAAPTFAGIPVTQRGVAESFIVCTGVGRKGKEVQLPGYDRPRTLVILMGVARISQVIKALVDTSETQARRDGPPYPLDTPIAIIERASMPDQRVITSTLKDIVRALESTGEQRPPGMMIIGWAVLALSGKGDVGVLDESGESQDEGRIKSWLGHTSWKVHEGLDVGWESI